MPDDTLRTVHVHEESALFSLIPRYSLHHAVLHRALGQHLVLHVGGSLLYKDSQPASFTCRRVSIARRATCVLYRGSFGVVSWTIISWTIHSVCFLDHNYVWRSGCILQVLLYHRFLSVVFVAVPVPDQYIPHWRCICGCACCPAHDRCNLGMI